MFGKRGSFGGGQTGSAVSPPAEPRAPSAAQASEPIEPRMEPPSIQVGEPDESVEPRVEEPKRIAETPIANYKVEKTKPRRSENYYGRQDADFFRADRHDRPVTTRQA